MIGSSQKLTMARSGAVPPDPEWNISMAHWDGGSASILNFQYSQTNGIYFKSGGLKMYASDILNNVVMEYDLGTAWDITTASYLQQSSSIISQTTTPTGLFFKPDGTKMYIMDRDGDVVYEYDLTTAWDVTTVTYNSNSFTTSEFTTGNPHSLFFKPDGTKMYINGTIGSSNSSVVEYDLSTAWDVTTASYSQTSANLYSQVVNIKASYFKPDGTKMYAVSQNNDLVAEYDLSTAWDISTITYSQTQSTMPGNNIPYGFFMSYDGTKAYVNDQSKMHQYTLSTAWDISTMAWDSFPNDYLSLYSVTNIFLTDLFLKSDGTKMYVIGAVGDAVYEYTLSTAWDMSTASYVQSFSVATEETNPNSVFFKSDGTKMYVMGSSGDDVNEYNLSTAWDISTASYSQKFSISAQQNNPYGLSFSSDGTKMYVLGDSGDDIDQYNLSTAWDVSTATYSTVTFSVSTQTIQPRGMFFKPDGTILFVVDVYRKKVFAYNLSTAWDLSTASYSKQYDYNTPTGINPQCYGIAFKSDGTEFYLVEYSSSAILTYYMY